LVENLYKDNLPIMKQKLILTTMLSGFILSGCMANNGNRYTSQQQSILQNNNSYSNQPSSTGIKKSLAYMYDEERLAQEVYLAIYEKQPLQQLSKIASKAEGRHIEEVKRLAQHYGVPTPYQQAGRYATSHIQSLYNKLYAKGIRSKKDALEVGCIVEVVDVDDLNNYISEAERFNAKDVVQSYNFLRKGSYNHYWSFDRGLKQIGISDGCCSLGQKYCHPEYPKKERGESGRSGGGGWRR
jgi:hypothetical protein